ncbi:c2 [Columbid circovirus]|uniref:C2 n=1 Tax=Pigeon circovirus TaxID=126070 RepID=Q3YLC8_PICV|nr:c2 [Columbid circovirus]
MVPDQPLVDPPEERLDTALFLAVPGIGGTVAGHYDHARRELHKGPFDGHLMRVPVSHTQQLTKGQPAVEVIYDDYLLVVVAVPPLTLHLVKFTSGVLSCPTALPATGRARDDDDFRFEVTRLLTNQQLQVAQATPILDVYLTEVSRDLGHCSSGFHRGNSLAEIAPVSLRRNAQGK